MEKIERKMTLRGKDIEKGGHSQDKTLREEDIDKGSIEV